MMKEKLKYEAPVLTAVEFRNEIGYLASLRTFDFNQTIIDDHLELLTENELNAGQFTNVDMTAPTGSWVYTEEGTWF